MIGHVTCHKLFILARVLRRLSYTAVSCCWSCSCKVLSSVHLGFQSNVLCCLNYVSQRTPNLTWCQKCQELSSFERLHVSGAILKVNTSVDLDIILTCCRHQNLRKLRKNLNQLQFLQAMFRHRHLLNCRVIFSSIGSSGNRFGVPTSLLLDSTSKMTRPRSLLTSG